MKLLLIPLAAYLLALAALVAAQRRLIYPAPARPPAFDVPPDFMEARLRTADGLTLRALHRPPVDPGLPTIVFFHGNGDGLDGTLVATRLLARRGYGLLLPEYRGYGGNPGAPSEAGLYRDGEAALAWLRERGVPPASVALVGNSLGSGVATELAARHRVAALALVSGFTSLADVAAPRLRLFPVRLLLRDRYANRAKLARVAAPVLVLHGEADALIPPDHARRLADASPRARLLLAPGMGHELAYRPEAQAVLADWLAARSGPRPPD